MGLADGFTGSHLYVKIAFISLLLTQILNWVAFCTVRWGEGRSSAFGAFSVYGLWRICPKNGIGCSLLDGWGLTWYGAFQAFVTLGFLGINIVFFFLVLFMFVTACKKNADIIFWGAIMCFVTATLYLIGCIIFAVKFTDNFLVDDSLDWSFYLGIITIVLEVFSGIFLILGAKVTGVSPI